MNHPFDAQQKIVVTNIDVREGTKEYQISRSLHGLKRELICSASKSTCISQNTPCEHVSLVYAF